MRECFLRFYAFIIATVTASCSVVPVEHQELKRDQHLLTKLNLAMKSNSPNEAERIIGRRAEWNTERRPNDRDRIFLENFEDDLFAGRDGSPKLLRAAKHFVFWEFPDKSDWWVARTVGICWFPDGSKTTCSMILTSWGMRFAPRTP